MKQLIVLIIVLSLLVVGCGQSKMIDGKEYKTVGIAEMYGPKNIVGSDYSEEIQYEICWGNVVWGALTFQTIVMPIYFYGFSMYNPVKKMDKEN